MIMETKTKDAYIAEINDIKPHPNADKLELAYIKGWQCIVGKGEFKVGDKVLYIQPDAVIYETMSHPKVNAGIFSEEDAAKITGSLTNKWTEGIRRYLAKSGRVKIVTLRGELSNGLIVKLDDIKDDFVNNAGVDLALCGREKLNDKFEIELQAGKNFLAKRDIVTAATDCEPWLLQEVLGIGHYTPPIPQDLSAKSSGMPTGVEKSDEENYQSLDEKDLHIGEQCLATRKMDGSSGTIYYDPKTDTFDIYSRSLCLKQECVNNYTVAMLPLKDTTIALGKFYGEPIAIRGEVCGNGMNGHKANKDAKLPLCFYVYGVRFPQNTDPAVRFGRWKSGRHFLDVVGQARKLGFTEISTVKSLGEFTITRELLKEWETAPAEDGEGIVVNGAWDNKCGTSSYKVKSAYYYAAMK